MSPSTAGYEVHKVAPAGATGTSLSATAYQCSSYLEFPVAKYQLGVFNKGSDKPLKVFNIDLKVDTYFTILISPESIDLFDDTNDPKAKSATLTVRNYFVGSGISISTGSGVTSGSIVYGHAVQMPRFPLDVVRVALKAALPGGKQTASDLDVDFKHNSRATLLIMPDSYGRFRTRLIFDGKNL